MAAQVHVLRRVDSGEDFPLREGESYIAGRSDEAHLVIREDSVSRKHARFYFARGRTWVRDLGSKNGTHVNGRKISVHHLAEGDRLAIGAHLFRVALVSADSVNERTPPEESSGRSMSGNIRDIPLADVLQWLATSRKTGTLKVHGAREGSLYLRSGMVCYASIDGREKLSPDKALLRMLGWKEGGFGLDSAEVEIPGDQEMSASLESVLMEAARQQDELAHLAERKGLPDERVELIRPAPVQWSTLEPTQIDLIQAVAEGGSWEDILDWSPTDDVATAKAIIELKKLGLVSY
jgi:hypothetical protein